MPAVTTRPFDQPLANLAAPALAVAPAPVAQSRVEMENQVIRRFGKSQALRIRTEGSVLADLLLEPDAIPLGRAEVLIPDYLSRLERELERERAAPSIPILRA